MIINREHGGLQGAPEMGRGFRVGHFLVGHRDWDSSDDNSTSMESVQGTCDEDDSEEVNEVLHFSNDSVNLPDN